MSLYKNLYKIDAETGCWNWTASLNSAGRPRVSLRNNDGTTKTRMAYSVICEAVKGPLPVGMVCSHLCHNKLCVNPDHVVYETQRENLMRRGVSEMRTGTVSLIGKNRWRARLTSIRNNRVHLGVFKTKAEAQAAVKAARVLLNYEESGEPA